MSAKDIPWMKTQIRLYHPCPDCRTHQGLDRLQYCSACKSLVMIGGNGNPICEHAWDYVDDISFCPTCLGSAENFSTLITVRELAEAITEFQK